MEEIFLGRSLIKTKNKSGPRTEPCGTPEMTLEVLERWLPITVNWVRSERKQEIHDNIKGSREESLAIRR